MWGPGATSCIIRFICHIPTGMMGFEGYDYYQSVKDYGEIYDSIPNGWIFLQGMKTVGMAVCVIPHSCLSLLVLTEAFQGHRNLRMELYPVRRVAFLQREHARDRRARRLDARHRPH